jgi:hypothetical protein
VGRRASAGLADPRVVLHLESAEDVVFVRGTAADRPYLPDADPDFDIVYALRPQSAMMWCLADAAGHGGGPGGPRRLRPRGTAPVPGLTAARPGRLAQGGKLTR